MIKWLREKIVGYLHVSVIHAAAKSHNIIDILYALRTNPPYYNRNHTLIIAILKLLIIQIYFQPASYGKKNGMWYASPGNQGWGNKSLSRKPSVLEADVAPSAANALKPSAGRVIRIINNLDHTVQVSNCHENSKFTFLSNLLFAIS